ncbi:hypothetical protein [Nostoc phage N1]|nr:hypothetical protein [Nostoc phage N1]
MKIKPTDVNTFADDSGEITPESDQQLEVTDTQQSKLIDLTVNEVVTPGGREAIAFVSPISGKNVVVLKPTTPDLIAIERTINKKHRDAGQFEQSIVYLSFLICEYGDKKGMKILSFENILNTFEPNEILGINGIANEFFRLGQI